jgi:zinc and cadmium transporter
MSTAYVAFLFFLLPLLAGGLVRVVRPSHLWLRLLLSFSGAYLLGVVFMHMLPELYLKAGIDVGLWVLAGFLLQVVLEYFSHGIEHGHMHTNGGHATAVPLITLTSLCVHSFAEGMPFAEPHVAGDVHFLTGVLLHKLPMAVALATVLQRSGAGALQGWSMLVVFALAAPAGIWAGGMIGAESAGFLDGMLGLAIGMLLHISTTIIFESAPEHRFNAARFVAVLMGAAIAVLTLQGHTHGHVH